MAYLGSFGAAMREVNPQAEKDTFAFFDQTFTVHGVIPPMLMLQLGAAATGKIDEQEGLAAIWEAMHWSLTKPAHEVAGEDGKTTPVPEDPSEFDRFYRLAVAQCCEIESLLELAMKLFEAQAGRPTERQPSLPAGLSPTSTSSRPSHSAHPALAHLRPVSEVLAG